MSSACNKQRVSRVIATSRERGARLAFDRGVRTLVIMIACLGCNKSVAVDVDAPVLASDAPLDTTQVTGNPLGLSCSVTTASFAPAQCPAPAGDAGHATFCYRPQWPGVTGVDVLGGFGQAGDWTTPLVSLTDQHDGTWSATVALANATYPYAFYVHGGADGVIGANATYAIDQTNPAFVKPPDASKYRRSVSLLTVPQPTVAIHHVTGSIALAGQAQPCFVAQVDVGELRDPQNHLISEHGVANFIEVGPDGTFDIPVADGGVLLNIKYPFGLSTSYPDPMATPAVGVARTSTTVAGADVALAATDVTYATSSYMAMTPVTGGSLSLPIAFTWTLVDGAASDYMSITATSIAGNDPAYTTALGTATTSSWDGTLNNGMPAGSGTYYWGTWQKRGVWASQSLLFPFQLQ